MVTEWKFDPTEILSSKRKVTGTFHKPMVDKDGEFITSDAIRKSIPDYMHLPALHDFHKERPVGIATKVWENSDGSFGFEGVIKATEDCNDIWEKISKGNYDHVSIFGKRTEGNQNCSLPQGLRTGPCITNGVRLDSISVCDDNARNDSTSLAVKKAQLIFDAEIVKADWERTKDGNFRSTPYKLNPDGSPAGKIKGKTYNDKGEEVNEDDEMEKADEDDFAPRNGKRRAVPGSMGLVPVDYKRYKKEGKYWEKEKKAETAGESNLMHTVTDDPEKKCGCKTKYRVRRGDMEKAKGDKDGKWQKEAFDKLEAKDPGRAANYRQHERGGEKGKRQYFNKGEEDDDMTDEEAPKEVEKGQWGDQQIGELRTADRHKTKKPGAKRDKPSGESELAPIDKRAVAALQKGEKEQEIDTEQLGEEEKRKQRLKDDEGEEEDQEEEMEEKEIPGEEKKSSPFKTNKKLAAAAADDRKWVKDGLKKPVKTLKKGEQMEENEDVQEYVTKAMVPIEEVDTIIKARTEEISKAYTAQFEEIKKAYDGKLDEIKKAYDGQIAELNTKVDKMAEETIRKGGSIVVIPQLLDPSGTGSMSNADALAKLKAGN